MSKHLQYILHNHCLYKLKFGFRKVSESMLEHSSVINLCKLCHGRAKYNFNYGPEERIHYTQNQLAPEQAHTEMPHSMCIINTLQEKCEKAKPASLWNVRNHHVPQAKSHWPHSDRTMTTELLHRSLRGLKLNKANLHLAKRGHNISKRI